MTKKIIKEIQNFILKYAKMGVNLEGYAYYTLNENLAVSIGWLDGYDVKDRETLGDIITDDGWGLNVGITENPRHYYYCDFMDLKMPYYDDGEICNTYCTLSQKDIKDKCKNITSYIVKESDEIIKLLNDGVLSFE